MKLRDQFKDLAVDGLLDISPKAQRILERANIKTMADLIDWLDHTDRYLLMTMPGLGAITLRNIQNAVEGWYSHQDNGDPDA